jgi:hypothetical protein
MIIKIVKFIGLAIVCIIGFAMYLKFCEPVFNFFNTGDINDNEKDVN